MSAPKNNNNSSKENRLFAKRLKMILKQNPEKLDKICQKLVEDAGEGNNSHISANIVMDRVDGKATETIHNEGTTTVKVITGIDSE